MGSGDPDVASLALTTKHKGSLVTNIVDRKSQIRLDLHFVGRQRGIVLGRCTQSTADIVRVEGKNLACAEALVMMSIDEGSRRLDGEKSLSCILWSHCKEAR